MELTKYGKANNLVKFVNAYLSYEGQTISNKILIGQLTDWPGGTVPQFDVNGMSSDTVYATNKSVTTRVVKIGLVRQITTGEAEDVNYNGKGYKFLDEFTDSVPSSGTLAELGTATKLLYVELKLSIVSASAATITFRQIGFTDTVSATYPYKIAAIYQNVPPLSIVPNVDVDAGISLKVLFAF